MFLIKNKNIILQIIFISSIFLICSNIYLNFLSNTMAYKKDKYFNSKIIELGEEIYLIFNKNLKLKYNDILENIKLAKNNQLNSYDEISNDIINKLNNFQCYKFNLIIGEKNLQNISTKKFLKILTKYNDTSYIISYLKKQIKINSKQICLSNFELYKLNNDQSIKEIIINKIDFLDYLTNYEINISEIKMIKDRLKEINWVVDKRLLNKDNNLYVTDKLELLNKYTFVNDFYTNQKIKEIQELINKKIFINQIIKKLDEHLIKINNFNFKDNNKIKKIIKEWSRWDESMFQDIKNIKQAYSMYEIDFLYIEKRINKFYFYEPGNDKTGVASNIFLFDEIHNNIKKYDDNVSRNIQNYLDDNFSSDDYDKLLLFVNYEYNNDKFFRIFEKLYFSEYKIGYLLCLYLILTILFLIIIKLSNKKFK